MPKRKKIVWTDTLEETLIHCHKYARVEKDRNPQLSIYKFVHEEWTRKLPETPVGKPSLIIKLSKMKRSGKIQRSVPPNVPELVSCTGSNLPNPPLEPDADVVFLEWPVANAPSLSDAVVASLPIPIAPATPAGPQSDVVAAFSQSTCCQEVPPKASAPTSKKQRRGPYLTKLHKVEIIKCNAKAKRNILETKKKSHMQILRETRRAWLQMHGDRTISIDKIRRVIKDHKDGKFDHPTLHANVTTVRRALKSLRPYKFVKEKLASELT